MVFLSLVLKVLLRYVFKIFLFLVVMYCLNDVRRKFGVMFFFLNKYDVKNRWESFKGKYLMVL